MSEQQHYFEDLFELLEEEQNYDRQQYQDTLAFASTNERVSKGVTWFPIAIQQTEIGAGDYLSISIQRTTNMEGSHQFRFGMPVALFSNYAPQEDRIPGTIAFVSAKLMRISMRIDELPAWTRKGKLGVDLLFDENSYQEMRATLKRAATITHPLIPLLLRTHDLPAIQQKEYFPISHLNSKQQDAVHQILNTPDIAVVHGPPGTGKTTTLITAIAALWKLHKKQLLVVAPSNTAVDLLTERLAAQQLQVLRIGNPVKVSEELQRLTLDGKMALHPAVKDIKTLKKQAAAYTDMAHKYKRSFGKAERDQRKALFSEARKIMAEVDATYDFISSSLIEQAEVITATLVGANHYKIKERNYHTVFIDEAGQALEPACWVPILKGSKLVLAGDHLQLPPTVKSSGTKAQQLKHTLLEKVCALYPERVTLLQEQYRMHASIMAFSSEQFYQGQLCAHHSVATQLLPGMPAAVKFIDTAGSGFEETVVENAIFNQEEAQFTISYLLQVCMDLKGAAVENHFPRIGLISPYRKQVLVLQQLFQEEERLAEFAPYVQINTIDSFQGQERDCIIISLTRSNSKFEIGFLAETRRMNVALTRAKKQLTVIGDSATLSKSKFYTDFINFSERNDAYHSIWEYMS